MVIKHIFRSSLTFAVLFALFVDSYSQENYIWPTDASRLMTSAFGEYRPDRFHAGIDIKTWNKTGYKVFAVDDGYLYRIKTSPFGSGKALYIKLNTGRIAVYYHLSDYSDSIRNIVKEEQQKQQKYSVEIWPQAGKYPVKRGEVVAYTGRSGSRLPHLHFEIRDRNNKPVNPLMIGFKPEDKAAPVPTKLSIRPMDINSNVSDDWAPVIVRLKWDKRGFYTLNGPINVSGRIGLSVDAFDINGMYDNRYGAYGMSLLLDGKEIFSSKYDDYSFNENRLMNLDRDYRLLRRDKGKFQKLYVDEGNDLGFYADFRAGDGVIDIDKIEKREIPFEVIIFDYYNNRSKIKGVFTQEEYRETVFDEVTGADAPEESSNAVEKTEAYFSVYKDYQDDYLRLVFTSRYDQLRLPKVSIISEEEVKGDIQIRAVNKRRFITAIPLKEISGRPVEILIEGESGKHRYTANERVFLRHINSKNTVELPGERGELVFESSDLFKDFWIRTDEEQVTTGDGEYDIVGSVLNLEPKEIPFRSNATLKIDYPVDSKMPDKLAVYAKDGNGNWHYLNSYNDRRSNRITVSLSSLETVAVLRDTVPPEIFRVRPAAANLADESKPRITVWFDDMLSGIGSEDDIRLFVDGKKVISEWDPIYKYVIYQPEESLAKGTHTARIVIRDRVNNTIEQVWNFTIR
ncbi:MAG: hypothetical protein GY863_24145 [bacterium]|nr:hypothetical protein [bacterium]